MISTNVTLTIMPEVLPFPKLMVLKNQDSEYGPMIVLFKREREGTVLTRTTDQQIGNTSDRFDMELFEDFHGKLQLENII